MTRKKRTDKKESLGTSSLRDPGISDPSPPPEPLVSEPLFPPAPVQTSEPKPQQPKAEAAQRPMGQIVPLRVYEKVAGVKVDQLAGFKSYAKRMKLGPMSVKEWKAAYQKFMGTAVK